MTWQGIAAMVDAVGKGHNVIDGSDRHFLFNSRQFPQADVSDYDTPNAFVPYHYVHTKDSSFTIPVEQRNLILGVQACAWSEFVYRPLMNQ